MPLVVGLAGCRVDVGDDRHGGGADVHLCERLAETIASRRHEGCVERAADGKAHRSLGPDLLRDLAGRLDGFGRSRDHHLAGSVVVGDPHIPVDPGARGADQVVVEPQNSGHGAVLLLGCHLHRLAALGDEPNGVLVRERARSAEGAVLTEAVARSEVGRHTRSLHGVQHHHRQNEGGQLAVARVFQLVRIGAQKQVSDIAPAGVGGLIDELPRVVIDPWFAHPLLL